MFCVNNCLRYNYLKGTNFFVTINVLRNKNNPLRLSATTDYSQYVSYCLFTNLSTTAAHAASPVMLSVVRIMSKIRSRA